MCLTSCVHYQAEDARQLHQDVREKLMRNIQSQTLDPKEELKRLFALIDVDGSNKLR